MSVSRFTARESQDQYLLFTGKSGEGCTCQVGQKMYGETKLKLGPRCSDMSWSDNCTLAKSRHLARKAERDSLNFLRHLRSSIKSQPCHDGKVFRPKLCHNGKIFALMAKYLHWWQRVKSKVLPWWLIKDDLMPRVWPSVGGKKCLIS